MFVQAGLEVRAPELAQSRREEDVDSNFLDFPAMKLSISFDPHADKTRWVIANRRASAFIAMVEDGRSITRVSRGINNQNASCNEAVGSLPPQDPSLVRSVGYTPKRFSVRVNS